MAGLPTSLSLPPLLTVWHPLPVSNHRTTKLFKSLFKDIRTNGNQTMNAGRARPQKSCIAKSNNTRMTTVGQSCVPTAPVYRALSRSSKNSSAWLMRWFHWTRLRGWLGAGSSLSYKYANLPCLFYKRVQYSKMSLGGLKTLTVFPTHYKRSWKSRPKPPFLR